MKRGLVIGKFLPIHEGHVALIRFAAEHCDELIVSMSSTPYDPIDPALRLSWIETIFQEEPSIRPAMIQDDFDNDSLPLQARTKVWADFIRHTYPPIDIVFSSEEYGAPFAQHLGAEYKAFDPERKYVPVSATQIRQHPFQYWNYIPPVVRPYFVKKVCFYGSESTGKSTLAKRMAEVYNTEYVPEVAREIISSNVFTLEDIATIGHAHAARIAEKVQTANRILFCDTDAITTQIYSQHYLGAVPEVLYELEKAVRYDLYFLFDIDVPWVADDLRDLGHQREVMFNIFKEALAIRNIPYVLVQGTYEERERLIRKEIDRLLL
jgi:HTH-type transcriptional regulator, transcriptional repressor of NAD biosynthesis genes